MGSGLALDKPLGPGLHKSHGIWELFYFADGDVIIHVDSKETVKYVRVGRYGTTCPRREQHRRSLEAVNLDVNNGLPCSVGIKDDNAVLLLNTGPKQVQESKVTKTSIELL